MRRLAVVFVCCCLCGGEVARALPATYDLRNVDGTNYSTSVKSQTGGTCWTHGTMAAIEGNLQKTGIWAEQGESGEPNLAEYHLDWWNGFNQHNNDDRVPPNGGGLIVHQGGDYRVSAAYMTRGEGVVRDIDGQSYITPPLRFSANFHIYYPRHIEWYVSDQSLIEHDAIKQAVMTYGAMGTCMYYGGGFMVGGKHYQPPSSPTPPNHAITIVGWDDNMTTPCATNGAWLCKNSWGSTWNGNGHFWISYYDKHAAKEPQMGAVSFRDLVPRPYLNFYYHDYHGWRDTLPFNMGVNAFVARTNEDLAAVSFYTAADAVDYEVSVCLQFTDTVLSGLASSATGHFARTGFHTVDLETAVHLSAGQPFYIMIDLSHGGQAYDRTSTVPVLLGKPVTPEDPEDFAAYIQNMGKMDVHIDADTEVVSAAGAGESFYWDGSGWVDLTTSNTTANLCIKGLTVPATSGPAVPGAVITIQ